jgi:plastocyanin
VQKRGISSSVPVLVIIGTLIVGLGSGAVLALATFGIANTTTIIITQTTTLSEGFSQIPTNGSLNAVSYVAQVSIAGFAYSPQAITVVIRTNNTVMWTNMDDEEHTVTSANSLFDSGPLSPGQTFEYTFTTPGTYEYTCSFHPQMEGIVVVKTD